MSRSKALATFLFFISLASYFGKLHFSLELLSHFRVHFALASALIAAFFALRRQGTWVAISIIVAGANLLPIIAWYNAENNWDETDSASSLSVFVINVHLRNKDYHRLSILLDQEQPDIIGLMEVDSEWLRNLESITGQYQFRVEFPKDSLRGLALFSKLPIIDSKIIQFGESATPAIVASVESANGEFEIILAHPPWPLGTDRSARRNSQLQEMADYVRAADKQVLMLADLNTTMWSPYYREFEKESGLRNARAGYGVGATFPWIPVISIPIDHILMTSPSKIGNFEVHESVGSDHLPISASISLFMKP